MTARDPMNRAASTPMTTRIDLPSIELVLDIDDDIADHLGNRRRRK